MTDRVMLGMLTPSSNTVLEPVVQAMIAGLPEVSAHFSRFKVTEIALSESALGQFDDSAILRAADLLADAKVDVIAWNGTSSGWLGFEADSRLCARITDATGIAATTSMLALNDILVSLNVRKLALVTPYIDAVQEKIVANYQALGIACCAERHLGLQDNYSFAEVTEQQIAAAIRDVARSAPDAIAVICTNLRGAALVPALEAELGLPILDTVATAVHHSLRAAGVDPSRVHGWGSLFGAAG